MIMTIDERRTQLNQLFNTATSSLKNTVSDEISAFANELNAQLATNSNPNKKTETEASSSDASLESFKEALRTKGALAFYQDYNMEKIEKMIEEKKAELTEKLGLGESTQPPLVGDERKNALSTLEDMLDAFRKQLQEKLKAEDQLQQQATTLSTFLQNLA